MPQHKNVLHGHEIYYSGRPFRGHNYYILSLSDIAMPGSRKTDLKRNNKF